MAQNHKISKSNTQKLYEITDQLPEFTHQYFYSGTSGKSILTRISYALDIMCFLKYTVKHCSYFHNKPVKELSLTDIEQISTTDIENFLAWMSDDQKLSVRTIARRRSSLSGLFDYLINSEHKLTYNPVTGTAPIQLPDSESVTYLNLDDQNKLLNCIKQGTRLTKRQFSYHEKYWKRDLAIIFLFLDTGLKISELQALNVGDIVIYDDPVDDTKNECYILALRKNKKQTGATTKIFFSDESREYITEYLSSQRALGKEITENSPLFTTLTGDRLSIREIQQMLKKYVVASLGRNDISINKLRSSFAMEFYKQEKNILLLQQRMGHISINSTNVYARAIDREEASRNSRNWRNRKS